MSSAATISSDGGAPGSSSQPAKWSQAAQTRSLLSRRKTVSPQRGQRMLGGGNALEVVVFEQTIVFFSLCCRHLHVTENRSNSYLVLCFRQPPRGNDGH